MSRIIKKSEWVKVLNNMTRFNRTEGYVNDLEGTLMFFDSNVYIEDAYSFYVTKEQVQWYIDNYKDLL